jgi:hypothetical protein
VVRVVWCLRLTSHRRRLLAFDAQKMLDHLVSHATVDAFGGFRLPLDISDPARDMRDLHLARGHIAEIAGGASLQVSSGTGTAHRY